MLINEVASTIPQHSPARQESQAIFMSDILTLDIP